MACFANAGKIGAKPFQKLGPEVTADLRARARADYVDAVRPVRDPVAPAEPTCEDTYGSDRMDRTPDGICHLYGNVMEWTSSLPVDRDDPLALRYVKGKAWESQAGQSAFVLAPVAISGPADWTLLGLGFRCVRTAY